MQTSTSHTPVSTMKDLLAKEEYHLPKPGQILSGVIISVSKSHALIDLGSAGIGIVYPGQFFDNPDRMKALKSGDTVSTMLVELESDEGYRELSLKAAQLTTAWQRIRELKETGQIISTPIMNINKGGLIVQIEGVQGFLPLSQLSTDHYPRVEGGDTTKIVQALQKFKGQDFRVKVLDFSEEEQKLIVSERAIQEEATKEELAKLSLGQVIEGTITEVTDFGAFVRLSETLDGLIHSSEIAWKYIEDPRDVLTPGQTVSAKIISLDGGRVSLSLKALSENPWLTVDTLYQVDQHVSGRVIKVRSNGIFIELSGDIVGLIPAASLAPEQTAQFEVGKEYPLTVVSIDAQDHKIVLAPLA